MGIETYYEHGQWKNKGQGMSKVFATYSTKAEAVAEGRIIAKAHGIEHIIKRMDGTIEEKNSYGRDSFPPKG